MDEPFSGVDPVVREDLQTEILRLQSELRKTIVFVTHDIDEAIKLGDKVAVFGRGGVLQQYDEPRRLLSCPANDAGFVGADRGYRGLQFFHATGLPLHDIRHVPEPEIDALTLIPGDWVLVIVALTLYTVALLVRAVPEALDAVSPAVLDSATAVGYKPLTRMLKIELPLALPVLIASLRVVAVTNISMVAVGSVIGIGGLSTWFTEGYQANKSDQIIAGIVAIFVPPA